MSKKKFGKLTYKMLTMTLLPLIILGITTMSFTANWFTRSMNHEVECELRNITKSVLNTYDLLYPGDYSRTETDVLVFAKGDHILNDEFEPLDYIKEETGVNITLFYGDVRFLTTLHSNDGYRLVGTRANQIVTTEVLGNQQEHFYTSVTAGQQEYFAYYCPIFNSDGSIVGMIAALKPSAEVNTMIRHSVLPILLLSFIGTIIVGIVTIYFTNAIIESIHTQQSILKHIASGEFNYSISEKLLKRNDEFGDMACSTKIMQQALRKLIEIDYLTSLDNRRSGQNILKQVYADAETYGTEFAIAIGDIDYFKKFNDTYGHDCGDLVLQAVAHELKKGSVGKGRAVRWGGEEFLIILDRITYEQSLETIQTILENVRACAVEYNNQKLSVTMTFGLIKGDHNYSIDELIKQADELLYKGKANGRNQIVAQNVVSLKEENP